MTEEQLRERADVAALVVQADPIMVTPEVLAAANAALLAYLEVEES